MFNVILLFILAVSTLKGTLTGAFPQNKTDSKLMKCKKRVLIENRYSFLLVENQNNGI